MENMSSSQLFVVVVESVRCECTVYLQGLVSVGCKCTVYLQGLVSVRCECTVYLQGLVCQV